MTVHELAGDVRSPQPHWWRHVVTITEGAFDGLGDVVLIPMYGTWRGKATWTDAAGQTHETSLGDLVTWTAPCADDAMGVRTYCRATLTID